MIVWINEQACLLYYMLCVQAGLEIVLENSAALTPDQHNDYKLNICIIHIDSLENVCFNQGLSFYSYVRIF